MTQDGLPAPAQAPRHPVPAKERRYCWMVGLAFSLGPTELCPECSQSGANHRLLEPDQCGCFAPCMESHAIQEMGRMARAIYGNGRDLTARLEGLPKPHDGHPCTLPINHTGRHRNEEASQHCAIVVQAFHEHDEPNR